MTDLFGNADFSDIVVELHAAGAEFLLIGGWAMALHGHGRGTDDLDLFVRASHDNSARVYRALKQFGAPLDAHGVAPDYFAVEGHAYRLGVKPNLIEILTRITGVTFDDAWAAKRSVELEGRTIFLIGRAALLANKRAAGRAKDLADAAWLEEHEPDPRH